MAAFTRLVLTVSLLILIPGGRVTAMDTQEVCGTYFISSEKFLTKDRYRAELVINVFGNYTYTDNGLLGRKNICRGVYDFGGGVFRGKLDCPGNTSSTRAYQSIDLNGITTQQLESSSGARVQIYSNLFKPYRNQTLTFIMTKLDRCPITESRYPYGHVPSIFFGVD